MPLVLLLAGTVAVTPECGGLSDDCCDVILVCLVLLHVRADLLVDGLLELLVVEDGPELAVTVLCPVGSVDLHPGLADVLLVGLLFGITRKVRLSPDQRAGRFVPVIIVLQHLLQSPLENISPDSEQSKVRNSKRHK